jgi:hypothetical protein
MGGAANTSLIQVMLLEVGRVTRYVVYAVDSGS